MKINFYDFAGILAPGAVAVYGLARIYPDIGLIMRDDKVSFGDFGLLLILAYVAGQLLQSIGNFIEWLWWKPCGGMPSDWIRTRKYDILAEAQWKKIPSKIRQILDIDCQDDLRKIAKKDWISIRKQVYSAVRKAARAHRVDIFSGLYGMFRGVAASLLVILIAAFHDADQDSWMLYRVLLVLVLFALMRMHRFGVHYARELFVQFLNVQPGENASPNEETKE